MRVIYCLSVIVTVMAIALWVLPATRAGQSGGINIRERNPVVNEGNTIRLTAVNSADQPLDGVTFESGSPEVARVDAQTGAITGLQRGYATVTARRGTDSVSVFVVVTRVENGQGVRVPGDTERDMSGRFYITNPVDNVVLRKENINAPALPFAGRAGRPGRIDGPRTTALFAGPTALAVDNTPRGGVFIADTLNHSVRKINFDDSVETIVGSGAPGVNSADRTPFEQAQFRGVSGIALDAGGNLIIADTENHAIYIADRSRRVVTLLAGEPGMPGRSDGRGRAARFNRPVSIAINDNGRAIAVCDTGNRRLRIIDRDGNVTTLGPLSSRPGAQGGEIAPLADGDEFEFNNLQAVGFDLLSNVYIADSNGVNIVTNPASGPRQLVALAQPGTFNQATSIVVRGAQTFILDANARSEAEAVKVVTLGAPVIDRLSQEADQLTGGSLITVTGRNFAPESQVILGDRVVGDAVIESATVIRLRVPPQNAPGRRTLSVRTRGGLAQQPFSFVARPFAELNNGEITTIAGGVPFVGDGGLAARAILASPPVGVSADAGGNLFIADAFNQRIRRVDALGVITTIAGNGTAGFSGDGGPAVAASLNLPHGVALDSSGNIIIAEMGNHRVRRIDAVTGIITTVAGNGRPGFSGDGAAATAASLNSPTGVAVDALNNIIIADFGNNRVRKVDALTGVITTMAGNGQGAFGGDNGLAVNASLSLPRSVAFDGDGNLFIADLRNQRVRRVNTAGIITTVAGDGFQDENGRGRFSGDGGGALRASLNNPAAVAIGSDGAIFISDFSNGRVRKVDAGGIITTIAGGGDPANGLGDGLAATSISVRGPDGITVDGSGTVIFIEAATARVRRVDAFTGLISTLAGSDAGPVLGDNGRAAAATLNLFFLTGLAVDRSNNLFIAEAGNGRVRRIDAATGIITTFAGSGRGSSTGDGGPALAATFNNLANIALDAGGNLFIAEKDGQRIRRVDAVSGIVTTVAGNGLEGFSGDGGPATNARLNDPRGVALDAAGNIYIADTENHRIRRVAAGTGIITTIAGSGSTGLENGGFSGDGGAAVNARLSNPFSLVVDRDGSLLIADAGNDRVRRVDLATGTIITIAGGGMDTRDNVPALTARLGNARSLTLDSAGNIFIGTFNNRVRRIDRMSGMITTVAGDGDAAFKYTGDGGPAVNAGFALPEAVAIDGQGTLFIADTFNNAIRAVKGAAGNASPVIANATFTKPALVITGNGLGAQDARVIVNGADVSARIRARTATSIMLKGNKKKLNLRNGANQITISVNGVMSNTFVLQI